MAIRSKTRDQIIAGIKKMIPIIRLQKARDVSEANTFTLVKDLLLEAFGYDKYADLTSEFTIRGTFCDLAIKINDKVSLLVEVKAIGISLADRHVKQAVDYAANQGIEWVILTNSVTWRLYNIIFAKPIDKKLVVEFDITELNPKKSEALELLYIFTKEGVQKGAHVALRDRQDATSRFMLAALLLKNDRVLSVIRRELRRVVDVNVDEKEIAGILRAEVIKREPLEGPTAKEASRRVSKRKDRRLITKRTKKKPKVDLS